MRRHVIGVMGGSDADETTCQLAEQLGSACASEGWIILNGGRRVGVMDAVSRGARSAGGLVMGILPGDDDTLASDHLDVAICTGLGQARNVVNVLSSHVVVALPGGAGTASEVALAVKCGKPIVLLGFSEQGLSEPTWMSSALAAGLMVTCHAVAETLESIHSFLR